MLIPVYFTVAEFFKIDNTSTTPIAPGTVLKVTASGTTTVVAKAGNTGNAVGLAGDGFRTELLSPPASGYAADIVINPDGGTTRSTNRIYELYRETIGSGKMTVYSGVGKFLTSEYETGDTWVIGDKLYSSALGKLTNAANSGNAAFVGTLTDLPQAYPNGVPGVNVNGSMSLGTLLGFNLKM